MLSMQRCSLSSPHDLNLSFQDLWAFFCDDYKLSVAKGKISSPRICLIMFKTCEIAGKVIPQSL